jgi:hypothetical protein
MTDAPGEAISEVLDTASGGRWQSQYFYGDRAPAHAIISQIIALVGDNAADIVHVEAKIGEDRHPDKMTMNLLIFTRSLVLYIVLEEGGEPTTRVIPRTSLLCMSLLSAPVVTRPNTGSDWQPTRVSLSYPSLKVTLPYEEYNRAQSDSVGRMLASLVDDLTASATSRALVDDELRQGSPS